jgi:2-polyprenyl-3-methyl-5-hydroxy-6-metoxy-1,4-benzoquinol methylase
MHSQTAVDEKKLNEFMTKAAGDVGSTYSAMLVLIGERLGLYKAMAELGPTTSAELSDRTDTSERYVREWLANQAAGGYVKYSTTDGTYSLPPEQTLVLADENSPVYIQGAYQVIRSIFKDEDKFVEMFRTGKGLRWGEHHHDLFEGTARFYKASYIGNIVQSWIPSLDGVEQKLNDGAKVGDIGCGYGISTRIMAKAYPNSKFYGYDNHSPSIEKAKEQAKEEGAGNNIEFKVVSANEPIGNDYDLLTFFDCLHDMGDPVGAMKYAKQSLKPGGTCMIVEPMANDKMEDNLNPLGRICYAASTLICVPNSLADNGPALGAQAGERRTKEIAEKAGFTKFRQATRTPFNIIYEARP